VHVVAALELVVADPHRGVADLFHAALGVGGAAARGAREDDVGDFREGEDLELRLDVRAVRNDDQRVPDSRTTREVVVRPSVAMPD
jgi:hypothetical protein